LRRGQYRALIGPEQATRYTGGPDYAEATD